MPLGPLCDDSSYVNIIIEVLVNFTMSAGVGSIFTGECMEPSQAKGSRKKWYFFSGPLIELSGHKIFSRIFFKLQKTGFFLSCQALTPPLLVAWPLKKNTVFCGLPYGRSQK